MRTIRHYVDLQAREQPGAPYLIAPETGRLMTYAQLQADCAQLGRHLIAQGLIKGDKVALMLHNGYQTGRLLIGVMYAGYMVAPLNLLAQQSQLAYVLDHSDTRLVFTSSELAPRLHAALENIRRDIQVVVIDPDAASILDDASPLESQLPAVTE